MTVRLDQLRVIVCVSCGRNDRPLRKLPDGLNPNLRGCDRCLAQHGAARLAAEADRLLGDATPAVTRGGLLRGRCGHCGEAVPRLPDGGFPAWCTGCEAERRALLG